MPAPLARTREPNEAPCVDMAWHDLSEGAQALVNHSVGEASRFHIADVVKEGPLKIDTSDKAAPDL